MFNPLPIDFLILSFHFLRKTRWETWLGPRPLTNLCKDTKPRLCRSTSTLASQHGSDLRGQEAAAKHAYRRVGFIPRKLSGRNLRPCITVCRTSLIPWTMPVVLSNRGGGGGGGGWLEGMNTLVIPLRSASRTELDQCENHFARKLRKIFFLKGQKVGQAAGHKKCGKGTTKRRTECNTHCRRVPSIRARRAGDHEPCFVSFRWACKSEGVASFTSTTCACAVQHSSGCAPLVELFQHLVSLSTCSCATL